MDEPENRRTLHQLQSRALLADLLRKHQPLTLDFLMGRG